jgi:hypothetical protein
VRKRTAIPAGKWEGTSRSGKAFVMSALARCWIGSLRIFAMAYERFREVRDSTLPLQAAFRRDWSLHSVVPG